MDRLYIKEINEYLEELGKELDITKTEYEAIVKSYEAVGDWLSKETSSLINYNPKILPQGSFMLGTIVRPICAEDDIDIDLVCKLEKKPNSWMQKDLKQKVGQRLKDNSDYDRMLYTYKDGEYYKEGGRRCWTLKYSDVAGYHMDILPSFADSNLTLLMERKFSNDELNKEELNKLAIRITDNERDNYDNDTNVENWHKSNPFGYATWFFNKAQISRTKFFSLNESVDPVRAFQDEKLPLQRVVQLLKRHRDIMFSSENYNSENKPISIIITTLASRAYDKSENLIDAYTNIVKRMRDFIEERENPETGKIEKWVPNPANIKDENFADKWNEVKQKQDYFYLWLNKLEEDLIKLNDSEGKGLQSLNEKFSNMFGNNVSKKVFSNIGERKRLLRETGNLSMATGTGLLGSEGIKVKNHNFFGSIDNGK
ncbi:nucleotidyltransferase domain-containing protein [Flavobacterium marginilacus]|uniref:nucleotidyltransferase domain-containing protein n=1 Tax=Flavobacterium marginilacus TaxID=3003256 RepID=UPI00248E7DEC|nr:nucleotidyltransferase [Flavobacterium marginilacus]